jgi:hypothetical protein
VLLLPTVGRTDPSELTGGGHGGAMAAQPMVNVSRRCVVLSDHEERTWSEIEQSYRDGRGGEGMSAVAVGGVGIALMFALVGAPAVGLVLVGATTVAWVLWRYRRQVGAACEAACLPMAGAWADARTTSEPAADALLDRPGRTPEPGPPS